MQGLKKSEQVPDFQGQSRPSNAINDTYDSRLCNSGKHRRSRWDPQPEGDGHTSEDEKIHKVRKTRWASEEPKLKLPGSVKVPDLIKNCPVGFQLDPEVQKLKADLSEIENKLQKSELHDDRPEHERSPSPEPLYNNLGIRINTREVRLRQKLVLKRLDIKSRLIQKNPDLKQKRPHDNTNTKLREKLSIPVKKYPGYNFIGLILGPQGNTLKRMERESGARILLRGKGSSTKDLKLSSEKEDLHVRIEAHDKKSLDVAVQMVKKLLIPVAEGKNEHKRAQLAELARLKKDANCCCVCGEKGHQRYCCPSLQSTFMSISSDTCGNNSHLTAACPVPTQNKPSNRVDDANLFVGYLPQVMDENRLKELFSPFGKLTDAKVIRDQTTGLSKCYGFVKFENPTDAAAAVTHLNGYKMDGKKLAVRVAETKPVLGPSAGNPPTRNPGPAAVSQIIPGHVAWPIPSGSLIAENQAPFPQSEGVNLFQASCYGGNTLRQPRSQDSGLTPATCISSFHNPSSTSGLCSKNSVSFSSSSSNTWFPSNPDYGRSQIIPDHVAWPVPPLSLMPEHQASFPQSEGVNLFQASCYEGNIQLQPKSLVLGLTPASGISSFHDPSSTSGLCSKNSVSFSSSSSAWFPIDSVHGSSHFEPYFNKPKLESTPALILSQTQESNLKPPWPTSHHPR